MNLKVNLGKTKEGNDFFIDFEKQKIYLTLLLGATGTGKSIFHFQLYKELIKQNKPEELGFIILDNTRVDFSHFPKSHLIQRNTDMEKSMQVFEEILKEVKERSLNQRNKKKAIFVHIEECDQFAVDPDKTTEFYKEFIRLKQGINVYVTYSTSRPSDEVLPDWLLENADMKVVFALASATDCQKVIGNNSPLTFEPGERILAIRNKFIACQPFSSEELKQIQDFENGKGFKF